GRPARLQDVVPAGPPRRGVVEREARRLDDDADEDGCDDPGVDRSERQCPRQARPSSEVDAEDCQGRQRGEHPCVVEEAVEPHAGPRHTRSEDTLRVEMRRGPVARPPPPPPAPNREAPPPTPTPTHTPL